MAVCEARNPYRPRLLRIVDVRDETADVRTLRLEFASPSEADGFAGWRPGQFGEFTAFGDGECVFALANAWDPESASPVLECTFRAAGKVTHALRRLAVGRTLGFRGPYGNWFPVDDWQEKDLVFVGGGIGMAALRGVLRTVLGRRDDFGDVVVLNGARSVADMVYQEEMEDWRRVPGVRVVRTVDPGGETEDWEWTGKIGLLPAVFEELELAPEGRIVVACGPPVMLHFLFQSLAKMGYSQDQVVTTLENKMKCGIGHCGRCNIGPFYVCRDGPVITWRQLEQLPRDL